MNIQSKIIKKIFYLFLLLFSNSCVTKQNPIPPTLSEVGWLEQIEISPNNLLLHAKLDTGADTCSVHAENIIKFKQDNEDWLSFEITNRYGVKEKLTLKIIRYAKIKTKEFGFQIRPVVNIGVCLGSYFENIECNLVDRSHFEYPVLIGRNYLAGTVLVNSSETYKTKPNCK